MVKNRLVLVVAVVTFFVIGFANAAFCQKAEAELLVTETEMESDMQWLWGEVTGVDEAARTVKVKYLDYETDQEREITLYVDEKTTFENAKSFSEIKLNDTLSVDYVVALGGKNLAKNISIERPEDTQPMEETEATDAMSSSDSDVSAEDPSAN
ncbi:MAG: hypothetical protein KKC84_01595 [Candidatus Omnitrophica bacterium]|nr:hypothetical protein [Candidatus Omnitrophota bacterium]